MKKTLITLIICITTTSLSSCWPTTDDENRHKNNAKLFLNDHLDSTNQKHIYIQDDPIIFMCNIQIPSIKGFDPKKVFSDKISEYSIANFYYNSNYKNWFYNGLADIPNMKATKLKMWRTTRMSKDFEMKYFISKNSLNEQQFYQALAVFICRQPNGEPGTLITENGSNFFSCLKNDGEFIFVSVLWNRDLGRWHLCAVIPETWEEGCYIFTL